MTISDRCNKFIDVETQKTTRTITMTNLNRSVRIKNWTKIISIWGKEDSQEANKSLIE